jgi:hypothetical protein
VSRDTALDAVVQIDRYDDSHCYARLLLREDLPEHLRYQAVRRVTWTFFLPAITGLATVAAEDATAPETRDRALALAKEIVQGQNPRSVTPYLELALGSLDYGEALEEATPHYREMIPERAFALGFGPVIERLERASVIALLRIAVPVDARPPFPEDRCEEARPMARLILQDILGSTTASEQQRQWAWERLEELDEEQAPSAGSAGPRPETRSRQ